MDFDADKSLQYKAILKSRVDFSETVSGYFGPEL